MADNNQGWVIQRSDLVRAMAVLSSVIEARNTIPILSNVLIEAFDGTMLLTATNLDQQLTVTVRARGEGRLSTSVVGKRFQAIVAGFEEGAEIRLALDDRSLTVRSGRARLRLNTLPAADFPQIPAKDAVASLTMPGKDLAALLGQVSHAMSSEEVRYYLCGVFAHVDGDVLYFAATDGHRLARTAYRGAVDKWPDTIIPAKVIALMERQLKDIGDDVTLEVLEDERLRLCWDDTELVSKVVDGVYPDYRRVIPNEDAGARFIVRSGAVLSAIGRVMGVAGDKSNNITLDLSPDKMVIACRSPEYGDADEEISISYQGAPVKVGANARYLKNLVEAAGAPDALDLMVDPQGPWRCVSPIFTDFVGVLMPVRV